RGPGRRFWLSGRAPGRGGQAWGGAPTPPGGGRRIPGPASAVTRARVRIWLAPSAEPQKRRLALLHRVEAAVDPAMAGAEIRAPASIRARVGRGERQSGKCDENERGRAHGAS